MAKYARDLDEALEQRVKNIASTMGFKANGITIEAVRLKKSKNSIGEIVKANDLVKLFLADDYLVVIALYEDAFNLVDDETKDFWIESLLQQVVWDNEKEQISIVKPELQISLPLYHKYKDIAVQKTELAYYTLRQIEDKKREEKENKKSKKTKNE